MRNSQQSGHKNLQKNGEMKIILKWPLVFSFLLKSKLAQKSTKLFSGNPILTRFSRCRRSLSLRSSFSIASLCFWALSKENALYVSSKPRSTRGILNTKIVLTPSCGALHADLMHLRVLLRQNRGKHVDLS